LTANRLGVLGGSFNPVHLGHLYIARQSRDLFGLSKVVLAVASAPPHKHPEDLVPFTHRYAMVSLATSGSADLVPSPVELESPPSAYSLMTLEKLARKFEIARESLYFIAGGDSLLDVDRWYNSEILLQSYNFVFVMRPGVEAAESYDRLPASAGARVVDCRGLDAKAAANKIQTTTAAADCRIYLIQAGAPDIAASQIRQRVRSGQGIEALVPASVNEYIQKLHLYGD
jgi:nicotinate-nucleotide adenylyltransferase